MGAMTDGDDGEIARAALAGRKPRKPMSEAVHELCVARDAERLAEALTVAAIPLEALRMTEMDGKALSGEIKRGVRGSETPRSAPRNSSVGKRP